MLLLYFINWDRFSGDWRLCSFQMTRVMKVMTILTLPSLMTSNSQRSSIQYYSMTTETTTEWSTMQNLSQRKSQVNEAKNRWSTSRFKKVQFRKYSRLLQLVYSQDDHELLGHNKNEELVILFIEFGVKWTDKLFGVQIHLVFFPTHCECELKFDHSTQSGM